MIRPKRGIPYNKDLECFKDENSRPLDVHLNTSQWQIRSITKKVLLDLMTKLPPQKTYQNNYIDHLQILVLNLFVAYLEGKHMWIGYPRNAEAQYSERFKRLHISGYYIAKLVDRLEELGYVQNVIGYKNHSTKEGKQSRIQATDKLFAVLMENDINADMIHNNFMNPEVILLSNNPWMEWGEKKVEWTEYVMAREEEVSGINELIKKADIELNISPDEMLRLQNQMKWRNPDFRLAWYGTRYRRIFSGDYEHGGRWQGHWVLCIPNEYRRQISINGEKVVELGYVNLHPRMTYDLAGAPMPECDLYTYPEVDAGVNARKVRKVIFNCLLNAETFRKGYISAIYNFEDDENINLSWLKVRDIANKMKKYHAPIADYFGTGLGLKLQHMDSEIARDILIDLKDAGIICLPVHESFIVARQHEDKLRRLMIYHYQKKMGNTPVVDRNEG
ncbi:MAG: hypothetical protein JEY79_00660 [Pseudodesulfovibrio sp.]|nr:hypothetical protein [Pseudodesulfovibrio sp.]